MKVIGFTSPDGVQILMTDKTLEVYDKGVVRSTFNITTESGSFSEFKRTVNRLAHNYNF